MAAVSSTLLRLPGIGSPGCNPVTAAAGRRARSPRPRILPSFTDTSDTLFSGGKVFDGEDETGARARVQTRGGGAAGSSGLPQMRVAAELGIQPFMFEAVVHDPDGPLPSLSAG